MPQPQARRRAPHASRGRRGEAAASAFGVARACARCSLLCASCSLAEACYSMSAHNAGVSGTLVRPQHTSTATLSGCAGKKEKSSHDNADVHDRVLTQKCFTYKVLRRWREAAWSCCPPGRAGEPTIYCCLGCGTTAKRSTAHILSRTRHASGACIHSLCWYASVDAEEAHLVHLRHLGDEQQ